MRKNKLIVILVLLITAIIMVGCFDRKDVDERYSPTIISFDKEKDTYCINTILMNFKDGKSLYRISEAKEKTLNKAKERNQYKMSGETSYSLLRGIVFGEEFSKEATNNVVAWINKKDINGNLSVCVYEGEGKELIESLEEGKEKKSEEKGKGQKEKEKSDGPDEGKINEIIELIGAKVKEGYKVHQSLEEFAINNETETKTAIVPVLKNINDKSIEVVGTAIFKDYKNILNIDLEDTAALMLLRGIKTNGTIEFNNEKDLSIAGAVEAVNSRKVNLEESQGKYIYNLNIELNCKVSEVNENIRSMEKKEAIRKLENEISREVTKRCEEFIEKSKIKTGYDIFDLVKYANIKYPEAINKLSTDKFFENTEIKVNVKVKVNKEI